MRSYKIVFLGLIVTFYWNFLFGQNSDEFIVAPPSEQIYEAVEPASEPTTFDYTQRKLDESFKEKYKGNKFNYHKEVKTKKESNWSFPTLNLSMNVFKFVLYFLIALGVLAIVYTLLKNQGGFSFIGRKKKVKVDISQELELSNPEKIDELNFDELVKQAKSESDYRKAIRFYYLWILQRLTEKKLINWHKNKTNYDYLLELKQNPIHSDFSNNSHLYNYVWYGNFNLNEIEFKQVENSFINTLSQLK